MWNAVSSAQMKEKEGQNSVQENERKGRKRMTEKTQGVNGESVRPLSAWRPLSDTAAVYKTHTHTHTHRNTSVITDWSRSFIQSLDKSEGWRSKMLCCNKTEWKHLLVLWQYFAQPACIPVNFLHNYDMHDSVSSNNNGKNKTQQHHNITWWIISSLHKSAVLI